MSRVRPWFKFYPSDWKSDDRLRACSAAARGLWIEMLCIMHNAEPYGFLSLNGNPVTNEQLAALTGIPLVEILALKTELENAGVYSVNRKGLIYSRRMNRDEKKRNDGEKSQKIGALPTSRRGRKRVENKEEKRPPPGVVMGVAEKPPSPQKPDTRDQKEKDSHESFSSGAFEKIPKKVRGPTADDMLEAMHQAIDRPRVELRPGEMVNAAGWVKAGYAVDEVREVAALYAAKLQTVGAPAAYLDRLLPQRIAEMRATEAPPTPPPEPTPNDRSHPLWDRLGPALGAKTFRAWVAPCRTRQDGKRLVLVAPSRMVADWLSTRIDNDIRRAVGDFAVEVG